MGLDNDVLCGECFPSDDDLVVVMLGLCGSIGLKEGVDYAKK